MKVLKWAIVLWIAVLGLMAGAPALAFAAPETQADMTFLQLLDQNGVSHRDPDAMVSFAHDLIAELSASPQNDAGRTPQIGPMHMKVVEKQSGLSIAV